jgi:hypothetical protein
VKPGSSPLVGLLIHLEVDLPVYMAGAMVAIACRMGTMGREDSLIVVGYKAMDLVK